MFCKSFQGAAAARLRLLQLGLLDLDLTFWRRRVGTFSRRNPEHALVDTRLYLGRIHAVGQTDSTLESPVGTLAYVIVLVLLFVL